jgi:hypothetical protein
MGESSMNGLKGRQGEESLVAGPLGTAVITTNHPHHTAIVLSPWLYATSNVASASSVSRYRADAVPTL